MNFPTSLPVNYGNSSIFYPDDTGVLGSFTKPPEGRTSVTLDYTSLMRQLGLSLQTVSFSLNFGTAPQLVISGASIDRTNDVLTFIVSGGLNGITYIININAALSDGATLNIQTLEVVVSVPGHHRHHYENAAGCVEPFEHFGHGPIRTSGDLPISTIFQQAQILNGEDTRFGSTFIVFWACPTPPMTANILDRWYNTRDGLIYDRVTDGHSVFWLASAGASATAGGIGAATAGGGGGCCGDGYPFPNFTANATAPTSATQGDFWYNTDTSTLSIFINTGTTTEWFAIGTGS